MIKTKELRHPPCAFKIPAMRWCWCSTLDGIRPSRTLITRRTCPRRSEIDEGCSKTRSAIFLKLCRRLPGIPHDGNIGFLKETNNQNIMKNLISHSLAIAVLAAGVSLNVLADPPSGQVDFGKLAAPGNGGEFVEIQVNSNLLSLAARLVEKQQPDAAKLLRGVQARPRQRRRPHRRKSRRINESRPANTP